MTFLYYKNDGSSVNVANYLVQNSLVIAKRCDEAFAKGSCQLVMEESNNIPPFTIADIDGEKFLIKSTATLYQPMCSSTTKYYVHDVEIAELSAFLEGLIVGTKVLSSDIYDLDKIQILGDLMRQKYGITFSYSMTILPLAKNEFRFSNGTTLWDALCQIMERVNCRPKVTDMVYSNNTKTITLSCVYLSPIQADYNIMADSIIQWTKTQDTDNYCEFLETEANNVIDTTNLAYDRNITERALNDTIVTETVNGSGKLYTNNKINKITKLEVCCHCNNAIMISGMFGADFFSKQGGLVGTTYSYPNELEVDQIVKTLGEWCVYSAPTLVEWNECQLYTFFQSWCQVSGVDFVELLSCNFKVTDYGTATFTKNGTTYTDHKFVLTCQNDIQARAIDVTASVLEKTQYDALANVQRPAHCYYTQGSNVIEGLHTQISQDIWGQIASFFTGTFRGPFMPDYVVQEYMPSAMSEVYSGNGWYTGAEATVTGTLTMYSDPFVYNVQYESIANPSMVCSKTTTPQNETNYKKIARSYGVSASQVDYDKLVKSMKISNDMLGQVEHTIEIKLPTTVGAAIPQLANTIKYSNTKLGYLLNYEIKYNVSYKSMVMYITSSVQNVANAIGIPYQYHATRLPVEGIVERPIRLEMELTSAEYNQVISNPDKLLLWFNFYKLVSDTPTIVSQIVTRACLMTQGNKTILYCEALDQYAFGYKRRYQDNKTVNEPVPYCDTNNEIYSMFVAIGVRVPTVAESRVMPSAENSVYGNFLIHAAGQTIIYKDQYEKLTFTIEIKEVTQ